MYRLPAFSCAPATSKRRPGPWRRRRQSRRAMEACCGAHHLARIGLNIGTVLFETSALAPPEADRPQMVPRNQGGRFSVTS